MTEFLWALDLGKGFVGFYVEKQRLFFVELEALVFFGLVLELDRVREREFFLLGFWIIEK